MSRYGASTFSSLLEKCVLWAPLQHSAGVSGGIDEFPIIPSGVSITNNGTFTKTSLGNNKSVLNFDGSTTGISLTDNEAWNFGSGDFTICVWVKSTVANSSQSILWQWTSGSPDNNFVMVRHSSNVFVCYWTTAGVCDGDAISLPWTDTTSWHFLVARRSGSNWQLFMDMTASSIDTISTNPTNLTSVMCIGSRYPTVSDQYQYLQGNLAHLMIWKGRALTQPEIKLLMNRTHPLTGAGLMPANGEYWRLT